MNHHRFPDRWHTLLLSLLYLALVGLHLLIVINRPQPELFYDELGYLGQARYFAGTGVLPNLTVGAYYHFGYSLLITPALWLFEDPAQSYTAALVINALLLSTLLPILYLTLRQIFRLAIWPATLIALLTSLYPPI